MTLWIILTVMVAIAAVGVTIPLIRRHEARGDAALAVFRDQLTDLDAQVAAGAVQPDEAEGLRTEIRKRLLAEDRNALAPARPLAAASLGRIALGLGAIIAVAATGLYAIMGRPELTQPVAQGTPPAVAPQGAAPANSDVDSMIAGLKTKLAADPSDPEGWRMLGWSYLQTGRSAEAVDAYRRAIAIRPNDAGYLSAFGEALVQQAGGGVTPEARETFTTVNRLDPADPRARYFLAVAKGQAGDRRGALEDLVELLNSAPADAPWAPELRPIVEENAKALGIDLTGKLKPAPADAPAAPMPNPEQVAAAQKMDPNDRQAMIKGMVEGLAVRLKAQPRDLEGWQRLMRARAVLGDMAGASAAYRDARVAFPGDTPDSRALTAAARDLRIQQ